MTKCDFCEWSKPNKKTGNLECTSNLRIGCSWAIENMTKVLKKPKKEKTGFFSGYWGVAAVGYL